MLIKKILDSENKKSYFWQNIYILSQLNVTSMSEQNLETQEQQPVNQVKARPKMAAAGAPTQADPMAITPTQPQTPDTTKAPDTEDERTKVASAETGDPKDKDIEFLEGEQEGNAPSQPTVVSDAQVLEYLKSQGMEFSGLDDLKSKLSGTPKETELSPEEVTKQQLEKNKQLLEVHLSHGGEIEQFTDLMAIAKMDDTELSHVVLREELKAEGFTDVEIENIIKTRYTAISEDEIESVDDEKEREFLKKQNALINKRILAKGASAKKQATDYFDKLKSELDLKGQLKQSQEKLSSKVDEVLNALPRKVTVQLGKVNDQEISPIEYTVSDEDVAKVSSILKDSEQRNKFFYNEDGAINVENIAGLLLRNTYLESMVKATYLEGAKREVAKLKEIFPIEHPQAVGVGGAPSASKSGSRKAASYGRPEVVNPLRK